MYPFQEYINNYCTQVVEIGGQLCVEAEENTNFTTETVPNIAITVTQKEMSKIQYKIIYGNC